MDLAQDVQHSLIVVSCLIDSWTLIREQAVASAHHRFPTVAQLREIPSAEVGEELVAAYLRAAYARAGFTPPYPTWPVRTTAFADAPLFSPRSLINAVQDHCARCRENGRVTELEQLPNEPPQGSGTPTPKMPPDPELDRRFSQLVRQADVADVLDEKQVDAGLPALLRAGLTAWAEENAATGDFSVDPPLGRNPSLHARLRRIVDADTDDEVHWSFRAVLNDNAVAALHRLRAAVTASGLDLSGERRRLFILRNATWSQGRKTRQALDAFEAHGGAVVKLLEADLKVFRALQQLLEEQPKGLAAWLGAHRPASGTTLLAPLSPEPAGTGGASASAEAEAPSPAEVPSPVEAPPKIAAPSQAAAAPKEADEDSILIGIAEGTGRRVTVPLEDLRRHTVIFAGSGSGKTVLIRRLVEECALKGVSAVVLDPNNDLARLGLPWPEPPRGWLDRDAERAASYLRDTEVVVWTPRLTTGRPLSFAPLSGLGDVADDADEFEIALDNAVASLVPRSGLPASGAKLSQGRAVLKEALGAYVRRGGGVLKEFLGYLSALPAGVSRLASGEKIAADVAQTLLAETVNDPLLGGTGEAVDPSVLLRPASGRRARISVISLVGLPNDEQRQQFVNQLQMALFAWVKKHPAGDRPLGGLFVMDEAQTFAPSAGRTATTASTLALASQARKYGLGLVFATQAPKGLHNQIPGNATTQFFGLLNAPAHIAAAREMAAQKGGNAQGIARLRAGEFFAASDAVAFQRVRSPMCLSHHPRSPMTQEEVLELARARTTDPE
ncbi:MAG: ATP-binding protein [Acidobacteria bacterium]|nr:ATP-binding protein [Acidobacteriota bacterium]